MTKHLLVIEGPEQGRAYPLGSGALVIGSSNKNTDICLNDPYVSRLHCKVEVTDDRIVVHDLKNSKGTFVNGTQVTRQDLRPGDVLRVGNSQLRLEAEEPVAPANNEPDAGREPTWLEELPGQTLGPYQVGSILGAGRHGVVFKATGVRSGHIAALKVLAPDFPADDAELQRFIRVVKPVLPLRHPHLVSLHGAGKAGAFCWLAGDYIEGQTAAHLARRQRQDDDDEDESGAWQIAFRLATHIARVLGFVHRNRLRHANITPNNILWHGATETAKLNDLVMADAINGSTMQQRVQEKKLLAELPYQAPEQIEENAFVDDLSDLYSLGVVTYEVLTGNLPFKGDTPEETISLIREGMPMRPAKHRQGVPPDFERAVLKMMALRQEDRYSSAAELVNDLERIGEATGSEV
jgi:eukaryotic-like serine/threonine-protein kinase